MLQPHTSEMLYKTQTTATEKELNYKFGKEACEFTEKLKPHLGHELYCLTEACELREGLKSSPGHEVF